MALRAGWRDARSGHAAVGALERRVRAFEEWARCHFLVVGCAVVVLAAANEFVIYGTDIGSWDALYVSSVLVLLIGLWLGLAVTEQVSVTLDRLAARGSLDGDPRELAGLVAQRADAWANTAGLAVAAVVLASFTWAFRSVFPEQIWFTLIATATGYFVGRVVGRMVATGTLGRIIVRDPRWAVRPQVSSVDGAAGLAPVGILYLRQASVLLIPAVFLIGWWVLIPTVERFQVYEHWRAPYLGLLVVTIVLQLAAFVLPMLSFHGQMKAFRDAAVVAAEKGVSPRLAAIDGRLAFTEDPAERSNLKEQSALLKDHFAAINRLPTWPVDAHVRRRFSLNNALLLVPLVGRLVGLSGFWGDLADTVREIFGDG